LIIVGLSITVFPAIFLIIEIIYLSVESTFTITSTKLQIVDWCELNDKADLSAVFGLTQTH